MLKYHKILFRLVITLANLILAFGPFQKIKAQSTTSENWSKPNLLGFDTGWKFKPGFASPAYFTRNFNDDNWQNITYQFLDSLTPNTKYFQNIATIRRKFYVPDSMRGKAVDLFINHVGASVVYFDGKPVFARGSIGTTIQNTIAFQVTVPLILDSLPWHVLSIYYGSSINHHVIAQYGLRGFGITLISAQNKDGDHNNSYHHIIISLGIIAGFGLFFWFVFAFYPTRLASLVSALMLTNFSLIFLGAFIRDINEPPLSQFLIGEKLWEIGFSTTYGWLLLFIYSAYYKKLRWLMIIPLVMVCISVIMIVTEYTNWFNTAVVFIALYVLETGRMIVKGILKKKTGFWILAAGFVLSTVGTLTVIFNVFHFFPWYITPSQYILGIANDLCFPLTLALHLAWEFGSANRDLLMQLHQVSALSEKTLLQEQEKQNILSTQNETLELQVTKRTTELKKSLDELKSTQAQLIQSEKMASLGELTAGIAHEIQNPLNFVNNFSEVNTELIDELEQEARKGNLDEVKAIAKDIKDNEEKINHHGKRADAIVKGMLQHSRSSTALKEPTDINKLADEYLRLAYHGLRAKDKTFNATLKTDFDEGIGSITIIPQDIGRVILNLITNAFYAVNQKLQQRPDGYEPTVSVTTKKRDHNVEIMVSDNGSGIPQNIVDKIFQPFFTTKPTGQGTGLGLSLAYDIVKAHGGDLKVKTKEGEGTSFIITLPI